MASGRSSEFAIPIFDTGKARMRKAELAYMRAANLLAEKAVNVRSEARSAYQAYRSNYDIARHYRNSVVPLRTKIEEESLLTYNGMITNTFELLADTRGEDQLNPSVRSTRSAISGWPKSTSRPAIYGGGATSRVAAEPKSPLSLKAAVAATEKGADNAVNDDNCSARARPLLAGATAWTKTSAMGLPDAPTMEAPDIQPPLFPTSGPRLPTGRHPQRLDAAAPDEQRRRRSFTSSPNRSNARWPPGMTGLPVGLQRPISGADDRGGRRRPRPHLRHQQAAGAHDHPLARHDPAVGHGRRRWPDAAATSRSGKTFVYEFDLVKSGTFMYHPHSDEMVQMAMGMMGFFVIHPKDPKFMPC